MEQIRVSDLTLSDLRQLIKDVVVETLRETLSDPDNGMELQEGIIERIEQSLLDLKSGKSQTTSASDVASSLGLEW
ncbi:MAG: hypothetical protein AB7H80_02800 [Candidatus Kapaibacterium sp.]